VLNILSIRKKVVLQQSTSWSSYHAQQSTPQVQDTGCAKAERQHFEHLLLLLTPHIVLTETLFKKFKFSVHNTASTVEWYGLEDCCAW